MNASKPVLIVLAIVFMAMLSSAMMLVYSKHQSRKLFIELQQLKSEVDQLNTEWGQLQLEQSTHTTHGKVEDAARKRLGMEIPGSDQVVILRP